MNSRTLSLMSAPAAIAAAPAINRPGWRTLLSLGLLSLFAASIWYVRNAQPFRPSEGLGYALGIIGGSLMTLLLLYPLRKRWRWLQPLGALKHWFRFHMLAGIAGPLSVLYHSSFQVGSFNAAIALSSMLLVVASGVIGRFIYRKIHHGLFGSRATLKELQDGLNRHLSALQPALAGHPAIAREVDAFLAEVGRQPQSPLAAARHFLSLGWRRLVASRRIRRNLGAAADDAALHDLGNTLLAALAAAQRTAQFSTYERLFALWHVIHIPFLWMLFITAIVHVVAVHAY